MDLRFQPFDLRLARRWAIASRTGPGGGPGTETFPVTLVHLRDRDGVYGYGESAPSTRYNESRETVQAFLEKVDPSKLSFQDLEGSMAYLNSLAPDQPAARCAVEIALVDGAARRAGKSVDEFLGLRFLEERHVTCFSIGLDAPDIIEKKVAEAAPYQFLKLKLGGFTDRENLAALRRVAPEKWVRADANEAWKTKEKALEELEWLAADGRVEFVEQPMPASAPREDWQWLKARSPLPIMADESYRSASDLPGLLDCFHAVNVKLVKTGGILPSLEALRVARNAGLKTMLGCMLETSVLIAAAAHLAELTDYLDLDGNLLITNDPFDGITSNGGVLSMAASRSRLGLGVAPRPHSALAGLEMPS
jgi:L-alanine-DL-glutamate epimerase-like enolase superfamily enzyme